MLTIILNGVEFTFYTFTELNGLIQKAADQQKEEIAKQAIKLLESSAIEFDLIEYYRNIFKSYIKTDGKVREIHTSRRNFGLSASHG